MTKAISKKVAASHLSVTEQKEVDRIVAAMNEILKRSYKGEGSVEIMFKDVADGWNWAMSEKVKDAVKEAFKAEGWTIKSDSSHDGPYFMLS